MVGWHHQLDGHEFEQAPGICDGQGSLAYCSPRGCKESNMTERLNRTDSMHTDLELCYLPNGLTLFLIKSLLIGLIICFVFVYFKELFVLFYYRTYIYIFTFLQF